MYAALTTKEQRAKEREKARKRKSGACKRPKPSVANYTKPNRLCGAFSPHKNMSPQKNMVHARPTQHQELSTESGRQYTTEAEKTEERKKE